MVVSPITDRCSKAFEKKTHAVIGISPFNSYFTESRIRHLAQWGLTTFASIHIFVPDEPSSYTLEALGYSPIKAARKARRQANYLHNKIRRALDGLVQSHDEIDDILLNWARLNGISAYRHKLAECTEQFHLDAQFRDGCLQSSRWVLANHTENDGAISDDALQIAANYLLTELPLFVDSVGILGQSASVFCYHQCPPFLQQLYEGRFVLTVSRDQGFALLPSLNGDSAVLSRSTE